MDDAGQAVGVGQQHHGKQDALDDEDVDADPAAGAGQVLDGHRAGHRTDDAAAAADEQHHQQGELGGRAGQRGRHEQLGASVDRAAERGEHGAEHEQLEPAPRGPHPHGGRGRLVHAEHVELEPDVGGQDPGRGQHHQGEHGHGDQAVADGDGLGGGPRPQVAGQRHADRAAQVAR